MTSHFGPYVAARVKGKTDTQTKYCNPVAYYVLKGFMCIEIVLDLHLPDCIRLCVTISSIVYRSCLMILV